MPQFGQAAVMTTVYSTTIVEEPEQEAKQLIFRNMTSTEEVEHQARQLKLSNVPGVKWLEHQAKELTFPGVERRVHPANQLTLRNVCSVKGLQAKELTVRNEPCVERSVHPTNQPTVSNNSAINLRCLKYFLLILVFAAPVYTRNEDLRSTHHPERSRRQRDSGTNGQPISWLPKYESTTLHNEDTYNITCNKGQYLNTTKRECFPCPSNTFMHKDNHNDSGCIECAVDPYSHQQILRPANGTHGPLFGCSSGYYSGEFRHDKHMCHKRECSKCTNCGVFDKYERRPCGNDSDTVCCEEEDMVVVSGRCTRQITTPDPLPANSTSTCPKNHYFDSGNNTCKPCPPETYLDQDNHTSQFCLNCSEATTQVKPSGCPDMGEPSGNGLSGWVIGIVVVVGLAAVILVAVGIRFCLRNNGLCVLDAINRCCRRNGTPERGTYSVAENNDQVGGNNTEEDTQL